MKIILKFFHVWMVAVLGLFLFQAGSVPAYAGLAGVIETVKPSIVAIGTYNIKETPRIRFYGTGFAVGNGRYVVTNDHVFSRIEEEEKTFHLRIFHSSLPSSGIRAHKAARDSVHDLALLGLEDAELPPLPLGDSSDVKEGQSIAFTGYPIGFALGLNPTTHTGIVSAISPIMRPSPSTRTMESKHFDFLRNPYDVFQLDATAYPGNSGSPLYWKDRSMVIGVINKVFVQDKREHLLSEPTGITYAIPVKHARALLDKVMGD